MASTGVVTSTDTSGGSHVLLLNQTSSRFEVNADAC
jgi:hypothetical protein